MRTQQMALIVSYLIGHAIGIVQGFAIVNKQVQQALRSHYNRRHEHHHHHGVTRTPQSKTTTTTTLFVRNIDLPEAVLFYGNDSFLQYDETGKRVSFKPGLDAFLSDCASRSKVSDSTTAIIFLIDKNNGDDYDDHISQLLKQTNKHNHFHFHGMTVTPPNPRDLYQCVSNSNITIQPDSFGGSSGFGKQVWQEPPRCPMPSRCVAVTTTTKQSLAAAYMGMRVIRWKTDGTTSTATSYSSPDDDGDDDKDMIADVVFQSNEWEAEWLEDIATPGSYWLNPPHPRDQFGNRIDNIQAVIDYYDFDETRNKNTDELESSDDFVLFSTSGAPASSNPPDDDLSEEEFERLLADLAPLKDV